MGHKKLAKFTSLSYPPENSLYFEIWSHKLHFLGFQTLQFSVQFNVENIMEMKAFSGLTPCLSKIHHAMDLVGNNLLLHMKEQHAKVFIFLPLVGEYESEGLYGTV